MVSKTSEAAFFRSFDLQLLNEYLFRLWAVLLLGKPVWLYSRPGGWNLGRDIGQAELDSAILTYFILFRVLKSPLFILVLTVDWWGDTSIFDGIVIYGKGATSILEWNLGRDVGKAELSNQSYPDFAVCPHPYFISHI